MQSFFLPAWALALAVGSAQTVDLAPELAALAQIKTTMAQTLARQPNYTCVQQIERSHRRLPKRKFELHDVVRIEVALADGKEMFAWPGARKFERSDLTEMVTGGAIGTGDFALHARAVFQTSAPRFTYVGISELRGNKAVQYDFVVPLLSSGYRLKSGGREAVVGYHGSAWADFTTHELMRLEVNADDIPPELGVASARDLMDYGQVKIGDSPFLLPIASELTMVDLAGNESRNRTQFKACRQYTGESVLRFDEAPETPPDGSVVADAAATAGAPATPTDTVDVPAGRDFDIRLTTEVDSASAAVGDPVTALLDEDIKQKRHVLFPKGAKLIGRILRLERHGEFAVLDLLFSEIESGQQRGSLVARVEETPIAFVNSRSMFMANERPPEGGIKVRSDRIRLRNGSRLRLRTFALTGQLFSR